MYGTFLNMRNLTEKDTLNASDKWTKTGPYDSVAWYADFKNEIVK